MKIFINDLIFLNIVTVVTDSYIYVCLLRKVSFLLVLLYVFVVFTVFMTYGSLYMLIY